MSASINKGPTVTRGNVPRPKGLLAYAKNVLAHMTGNLGLPTPTISLTAFGADVSAFDDAQTKSKDRSKVAVADRNAKALKVSQDVGHLEDYVQSVVETLPNPADAIALILSAGMQYRKNGKFNKPALAAKYGSISGEVLVVARAVPGAGAYFWEFSLDQAVWTTFPETKKSRVLIPGLTSARVYYFRFRTLTSTGKSDYSQIVSLLVH